MDIVILQTTQEKTDKLSRVIQENLGFKINFHSQQENYESFNEYYMHSLKIVSLITLILLLIITCISVWSSLVSVCLMLKDFTINLLVGLSYSKLRKVFYSYFAILSFINLIFLFLITAYVRYGCWLRKDSTFVTYGLFGLIDIDWIALLVVLFSDVIIGMIIAEIMLNRIKKIPISLGVLQ